ncbi:hypothetical protein KP509_17G021200 [Ceratopteris richardii]|uniref:Uncharacterized protein n=1 Tax=Ceratopteris richardii TaxID=49495 RepID=A0A8T2SXI6_CERRI|nr:hypothetical protein KP509_17G021200 [Ceratopteris richardii]
MFLWACHGCMIWMTRLEFFMQANRLIKWQVKSEVHRMVERLVEDDFASRRGEYVKCVYDRFFFALTCLHGVGLMLISKRKNVCCMEEKH